MMDKRTAPLAALALALAVQAFPASAQRAEAPAAPAGREIALRADPAAPETRVVASVYADFIKQNPGMRIETAMVDLEGKGVASVAAKFVSPATCAGDRCSMVVLNYGTSGWRPIFEHTGRSLAVGPTVPGYGTATLIQDGGVRWTWTGLYQYMPDLASVGTVFRDQSQAPADVAQAARTAMGAMLPASGPTPEFRQVALDVAVSSPIPANWVRGYAAGACGNTVGCPHALLTRSGSSYRTLWSGMAFGPGAVMPSSSNGMRDVALGTPTGYLVLRFDGQRYVASATSYPSSVTPSP